MIIAHRGVSFTFPENSLPAFEASWQLGVDGIEGDFHLHQAAKTPQRLAASFQGM
jgi:glycerophosphoryl diester phosphodiesterase